MLQATITINGTIEELMSFLNGRGGNVSAGAIHVTAAPGATIPDANSDDDAAGPTSNATHDSAGIPWDERIHSAKRGLNTDQTWRKRRGVTATTIAAVEAELKARGAVEAELKARGAVGMYMPPNAGQQQQPPPVQMPMPMPPNAGQQQQPQYAPPQMPPPQQQYQQLAALDFGAFMGKLAEQMGKRMQDNVTPLVDANYLATVCQRLSAQFGRQFNTITEINGDQNAINLAVALMTSDGRWF